MTRTWKRLIRRTAPIFLSVGLLLSPAITSSVRAQEPAPAGEQKGEGRYLDGYLGTVTLMLLVFFVVGKSARR